MAKPKKKDVEFVDELLSKFDLNKYKGCHDLSLTDWFHQLVARQDLITTGPLANA